MRIFWFGFLLSKICHEFWKNSQTLTKLLKKESFHWNDEATQSFLHLKQALVPAPVLRLPNFAQKFTIETDTSDKGIGVFLMQDHHPIAYIRKSLGPKQQATRF